MKINQLEKLDINKHKFNNNSKDLTGKRFGRLFVVGLYGKARDSLAWKCLCDCGTETFVITNELNSGKVKSCGCLARELTSQRNTRWIDKGTRFGRLVVVERQGSMRYEAAYLCNCDCGDTTIVRSYNLKKGLTTSCGCYARERAKEVNTTHGMTGTIKHNRVMRQRRRELKKKHDSEWNIELAWALKDLQKACVVCGNTEGLVVDHVRPLSKGFGLKPGNAVILCISCNSVKKDRDLEDLEPDVVEKIATAANQFKEFCEHMDVFYIA